MNRQTTSNDREGFASAEPSRARHPDRAANGDDPFEDVISGAARVAATVGVAESLTGGLLATRLAEVSGSGGVFMGGIVAYDRSVKHDLLGVPEGPVVSGEAATNMATATRRLLGCDFSAALTGVAGPDPQDGQSPGTVFVATAGPQGVSAERVELAGDPDQICEQAARLAALALAGAMAATTS